MCGKLKKPIRMEGYSKESGIRQESKGFLNKTKETVTEFFKKKPEDEVIGIKGVRLQKEAPKYPKLRFMGYNLDISPEAISARLDTNGKGYIESDTGLLMTLGLIALDTKRRVIGPNLKVISSKDDIRRFLMWIIRGPPRPLPDIVKRVLCSRRDALKMSMKSINGTPNGLRLKEKNLLEEIDEILKMDLPKGVDSKFLDEMCFELGKIGGVGDVKSSESTKSKEGCDDETQRKADDYDDLKRMFDALRDAKDIKDKDELLKFIGEKYGDKVVEKVKILLMPVPVTVPTVPKTGTTIQTQTNANTGTGTGTSTGIQVDSDTLSDLSNGLYEIHRKINLLDELTFHVNGSHFDNLQNQLDEINGKIDELDTLNKPQIIKELIPLNDNGEFERLNGDLNYIITKFAELNEQLNRLDTSSLNNLGNQIDEFDATPLETFVNNLRSQTSSITNNIIGKIYETFKEEAGLFILSKIENVNTDEEKIQFLSKDNNITEFIDFLKISFDDDIQRLNNDVRRLNDEIAQNQAIIAERERIISELQGKEHTKEEIDELNKEIKRLQAENATKQKIITDSEIIIATKQNEIATKQNEIATKDSMITAKDNEIATKDSIIAAKDNEIVAKQNEIIQLTTEIDTLNAKIKEITDRLNNSPNNAKIRKIIATIIIQFEYLVVEFLSRNGHRGLLKVVGSPGYEKPELTVITKNEYIKYLLELNTEKQNFINQNLISKINDNDITKEEIISYLNENNDIKKEIEEKIYNNRIENDKLITYLQTNEKVLIDLLGYISNQLNVKIRDTRVHSDEYKQGYEKMFKEFTENQRIIEEITTENEKLNAEKLRLEQELTKNQTILNQITADNEILKEEKENLNEELMATKHIINIINAEKLTNKRNVEQNAIKKIYILEQGYQAQLDDKNADYKNFIKLIQDRITKADGESQRVIDEINILIMNYRRPGHRVGGTQQNDSNSDSNSDSNRGYNIENFKKELIKNLIKLVDKLSYFNTIRDFLAELIDDNKRCKEENAKLNEQIESLNKQLNDMKTTHAQIESEQHKIINDYKQIARKINQIASSENIDNDIQPLLIDLETKLETLKSGYDSLSSEKTIIKTQIQQKEDEIKGLTEQLQQKETELQQKNDAIRARNDEIRQRNSNINVQGDIFIDSLKGILNNIYIPPTIDVSTDLIYILSNSTGNLISAIDRNIPKNKFLETYKSLLENIDSVKEKQISPKTKLIYEKLKTIVTEHLKNAIIIQNYQPLSEPQVSPSLSEVRYVIKQVNFGTDFKPVNDKTLKQILGHVKFYATFEPNKTEVLNKLKKLLNDLNDIFNNVLIIGDITEMTSSEIKNLCYWLIRVNHMTFNNILNHDDSFVEPIFILNRTNTSRIAFNPTKTRSPTSSIINHVVSKPGQTLKRIK